MIKILSCTFWVTMKQLTAKILLLGDQGVGKSTLALRLASQTVNNNVSPTVGVSYVETNQEVGDHEVRLQLWDTAGQERYKSMIPMYYRNSIGALLVYDVTDLESFQAVQKWEAELRTHGSHDLVIFVVGNKYDTTQTQRNVQQSKARAFADAVGGHFREVSALSNHGIGEMRLDLCIQLVLNSQSRRMSVTSADCASPPIERRKSVVLERKSTSSSISSIAPNWCCT